MAVSRIKECYKKKSDALYLSYLALKELPETLPDSVQKLNINSNQLTRLPDLPASLETLDISHNALTQLPTLPDSMLELNARDNQLTQLPALPTFLRELDVNDNRLTELPTLPTLLQRLDISGNRFTQVPQTAMRLTRHCHVVMESNPFSETAYQYLDNTISDLFWPELVA